MQNTMARGGGKKWCWGKKMKNEAVRKKKEKGEGKRGKGKGKRGKRKRGKGKGGRVIFLLICGTHFC